MKGFLSIKEAAEKWGISKRWVNQYALDGRIPGCERFGNSWVIPEDAKSRRDKSRGLKNGRSQARMLLSRIWSGILKIAGVQFEQKWTCQEYVQFLERNGWYVTFSREMAAKIAMMYTECEQEE